MRKKDNWFFKIFIKEGKQWKDYSGLAIHVMVIILSVVFIIVGNKIATSGTKNNNDSYNAISAVVTQIVEKEEIIDGDMGFDNFYSSYHMVITFKARITSGELKGTLVTSKQWIAKYNSSGTIIGKEISKGDRIVLIHNPEGTDFLFAEYDRMPQIFALGMVLFLLLIFFSRKKGLNAIISLIIVCFAIFLVLVPAISTGKNIYITAIVICIFSAVSNLLIVLGPNKKALAAIMGCLGGIFLAGLLMFIMSTLLHLTGLIDEEIHLLMNFKEINANAIVFASVLIGCSGAITDVATSISSSLWEIKQSSGKSDFRSIYKSGNEIGKDILGTMLNTLILAYIGSSLGWILLFASGSPPFLSLGNTEAVITEFLRALVGTFGMFFTIPATAAICAWIYSREQKAKKQKTDGKSVIIKAPDESSVIEVDKDAAENKPSEI